MKSRYSFLIRPINILIDLIVINLILYFIGDSDYINLKFMLYVNIIWVLISYYTSYYKVFRVTGGLKILNLIFGQFFIFILSFFSFFSLFKEGTIVNNQFATLSIILCFLFVAKFTFHYTLKSYREHGNNYRKVIIIGSDEPSNKLRKFFKENKDLGYRNLGFFSENTSGSKEYLGHVNKSYEFIINNDVDEIYCSYFSIERDKIKNLIWFAKANHKIIKLIPEAREIFRKNLAIEYYDTIPVLRLEKLPFELGEVRFIKRVFDIIFSLLICLLVLSWLIPLLMVLIKLESKGALFFHQYREGLNGKEFACYKFRSMKVNSNSDIKSASKDDDRITKIGRFIRKTSIDELPQFFNVLRGDMSVVGPRPHMIKQSEGFENNINNYYKRNAVKPGITGLAQIRGYRGEIQKKSDIENRVRLDVFYIENSSLFLDIKIIIQTFLNIFKGDEKAY